MPEAHIFTQILKHAGTNTNDQVRLRCYTLCHFPNCQLIRNQYTILFYLLLTIIHILFTAKQWKSGLAAE